MEVKIDKDWRMMLKTHLESEEFRNFSAFVKSEYMSSTIYPNSEDIFRALNLTPINKVRVVILGQDPYHGDGQAHGLSFSVPADVKNPPSLKNIFKELEAELGKKSEAEDKYCGDLINWAKQGVLLLNAVLTVRANSAGSHANKGWEALTDQIIKVVSDQADGVVFILWGSYARKKKDLIDKKKHLVLEAVHPSPLSAYGGFFGCGHFIKTNKWLIEKGKSEIKW